MFFSPFLFLFEVSYEHKVILLNVGVTKMNQFKKIMMLVILVTTISATVNINSSYSNIYLIKIHTIKSLDGFYDDFSRKLSFKESSHNPYVRNGSFYGLFQFGKPAIVEIVKRDSSYQDVLDNWDDIIESEVAAKKYFPRDRQIAAFEVHKKAILRQLGKTEGVGNGAYDLAKAKGISEAGMIAGAHLVGAGGLKQYLCGIDVRDGNGTSPSEYINNYGKYTIKLG